MDERQIKQLANSGLGDASHSRSLVETHISWVILTDTYAYKIKKPVRFSFLDFSTLASRKYYCEREVLLNKRLAANMYLNVLPVCENNGLLSLGNNEGAIIDYAVVMQRMDTEKEMDKLLMQRKVTTGDAERLARKIALFHQGASQVARQSAVAYIRDKFNDIATISKAVIKHLGAKYDDVIRAAIKVSDNFVDSHSLYLQQRADSGFIRDVHGDLHSGNIFLYNDPVIFDCIEFNDEMRQLDMLDEVAFLCMDLDAYKQHRLSDLFYHNYLLYSGLEETESAKQLFQYYKLFRANVRAKVNVLAALEEASEEMIRKRMNIAVRYFDLMENYLIRF